MKQKERVSYVDSLWEGAVADAEHGLCEPLQWSTELWNNSHHLVPHHPFLTLRGGGGGLGMRSHTYTLYM